MYRIFSFFLVHRFLLLRKVPHYFFLKNIIMKAVVRYAHELNDMGAGGQGTLMREGNRKIQRQFKRST